MILSLYSCRGKKKTKRQKLCSLLTACMCFHNLACRSVPHFLFFFLASGNYRPQGWCVISGAPSTFLFLFCFRSCFPLFFSFSVHRSCADMRSSSGNSDQGGSSSDVLRASVERLW